MAKAGAKRWRRRDLSRHGLSAAVRSRRAHEHHVVVGKFDEANEPVRPAQADAVPICADIRPRQAAAANIATSASSRPTPSRQSRLLEIRDKSVRSPKMRNAETGEAAATCNSRRPSRPAAPSRAPRARSATPPQHLIRSASSPSNTHALSAEESGLSRNATDTFNRQRAMKHARHFDRAAGAGRGRSSMDYSADLTQQQRLRPCRGHHRRSRQCLRHRAPLR